MRSLLIPTLAVLAVVPLAAEERIELTNGPAVYGTVIESDSGPYTVLLEGGTKIQIERERVRRIVDLEERGSTVVTQPVRVRPEGYRGLGLGSPDGRTYYEVGTRQTTVNTRNSLSINYVDQTNHFALAGSAVTTKGTGEADDERSLYLGRYSYGTPSESGWRTRWDLRIMYEKLSENITDLGWTGTDNLINEAGDWEVNRWTVSGHQIDVNALIGVGITSDNGAWALDGLIGVAASFAWYSSRAEGSFWDATLTTPDQLQFNGSGDGEYFGFFTNMELRGTHFFGPSRRFSAALYLGGLFNHQTIDDVTHDPTNSSADLHIIVSVRDLGYYGGLSLGASF
jgi:hypothetical protein